MDEERERENAREKMRKREGKCLHKGKTVSTIALTFCLSVTIRLLDYILGLYPFMMIQNTFKTITYKISHLFYKPLKFV